MRIRILESSLNLRVEKGKTNLDYTLEGKVARQQLDFRDPFSNERFDLYCNVEYMECRDEGYHGEFVKNGYNRIDALSKNRRGILCYANGDLTAKSISVMNDPHFLHFQIIKRSEVVDVIVFRILVQGGSADDFVDRNKQWSRVMSYIDSMQDTSKLILTGDWNHARILASYIKEENYQYYFNYQGIVKDLRSRGFTMGMNLQPNHHEHSYMGFLAIDHIAIGKKLRFSPRYPYYSEYRVKSPIGEPDHAFIIAEVITV